MKILIIVGIIASIALCCTYALNVSNIETNDRDVNSYHDFVPWIYAFVGVILLITAWLTFHLHFIAGILQYMIGGLMFAYGIYLGLIKIGVLA